MTKGIHMRMAMAGTALFMILAGCSQDGVPAENRSSEVDRGDTFQERLQGLDEGQRNAVFIRAIRDAGLECQHVESSVSASAYQGMPVWTATCSGGSIWTIVIGDNGIAQVLNAREAELVKPSEHE